MIKKTLALAICLFSISSFAMTTTCPPAAPTTDSGFCASFAASASCYCSNSLPKRMCENVEQIYKLMLARYGSIETACKFQKETTMQTCLDDWHCYRIGGTNVEGAQCSGSGKSCI